MKNSVNFFKENKISILTGIVCSILSIIVYNYLTHYFETNQFKVEKNKEILVDSCYIARKEWRAAIDMKFAAKTILKGKLRQEDEKSYLMLLELEAKIRSGVLLDLSNLKTTNLPTALLKYFEDEDELSKTSDYYWNKYHSGCLHQ